MSSWNVGMFHYHNEFFSLLQFARNVLRKLLVIGTTTTTVDSFRIRTVSAIYSLFQKSYRELVEWRSAALNASINKKYRSFYKTSMLVPCCVTRWRL